MNLSYRLLRNGVLNLPRPSPASKTVTENLLLKDAHSFHCYFRSAGLHNHLSHHILAAYDLGATPGHLQKIYDDEAKLQRAIVLEETDKSLVVTSENWVQYVGNASAYSAFLTFFEEKIKAAGVLKTLEAYIFSDEANDNNVNMLIRLMSGALHPFIQIGYGLEFGNDTLVATGLAQTAIHNPLSSALFQFENSADVAKNEISPDNLTQRPSRGLTVLEIMREVYDSTILHPVMPYDPNALVNARIRSALEDGRPEEIRRICSQFYVDETLGDTEMNMKIEELIWTSTLLLVATGKEGRKPRLDFFLMHLVTSSIFLPSYIRVLQNPIHKVKILRAYLPNVILLTLVRGRPVIQPNLLMTATDKPRPPLKPETLYKADKTAIGDPADDTDYNPWPALIESAKYAHDSHVLKTIRTLAFAAREFGDRNAGAVIGAKDAQGRETHPGTDKLDGSAFVRAAGMVMDYMGWTTHGQAARPDWDRSALGWDDAWKDED
ncbi:hypothetical protein K435DRAFT_726663 [Dendrothele bispora CBS 962.96]|uniref:Oxidoreductase AflY n=1 Tax=Dendrothele bispora (strain CBS 962.96) TaxID=1314807 RepID=A0A4S8LRP1_DENBC|nr:hypothetical protein K435DRAFT_726663 [Dendrothele bispora CBS 962.96]